MSSVLLVDDDADTLEMYVLGLSASGCRPFTASTVDTALRRLTFGPPDAVVTDLQMRGESGWELIDTIKGTGRRATSR